MTQEDLKNLPKIVEKFKKSNYPVALTGAGISAESGIPTFRGESGLWKNFRPEELATPEAFRVHPEIVREWYNWRREIISKAKPNPGHYALAELERYNPNFTIITQNVDGLHLRAGSKKVIELHGNIFREKCSRCNRIYNEPVYETLAYCDCGGLLRPDVVWFGEPVTSINEAINVALQCDFMFVIGTSGIVQPAASLPFYAKNNGAFIVEINLEPTPISDIAHVSLYGKSGEILPKIVNNLIKT